MAPQDLGQQVPGDEGENDCMTPNPARVCVKTPRSGAPTKIGAHILVTAHFHFPGGDFKPLFRSKKCSNLSFHTASRCSERRHYAPIPIGARYDPRALDCCVRGGRNSGGALCALGHSHSARSPLRKARSEVLQSERFGVSSSQMATGVRTIRCKDGVHSGSA
jgi:hypothetical protein